MVRNFKSLGLLIKKYRKERGDSQADMAKKYDVSIAAISSWERGVSRPGIDIAFKIAQDMGLSLEEFFIEQDVKKTLKLADTFIFNGGELSIQGLKYEKQDYKLVTTLRCDSNIISNDWLMEACEVNVKSTDKTIQPTSFSVFESKPLSDTYQKGYLVESRFIIEDVLEYSLHINSDFLNIAYAIPASYLNSIILNSNENFNIEDAKDILAFLIKTGDDSVFLHQIKELAKQL